MAAFQLNVDLLPTIRCLISQRNEDVVLCDPPHNDDCQGDRKDDGDHVQLLLCVLETLCLRRYEFGNNKASVPVPWMRLFDIQIRNEYIWAMSRGPAPYQTPISKHP